MRKLLTLLGFLSLASNLQAQDAYHSSLQTQLQTTYSLPTGSQWILPNIEAATMANVGNYGGTTSDISPTGLLFTKGQKRVVTKGVNTYDAAHTYKNQAAIAVGDRCLVIIWVRATTANAKLNIFAENATTYDKEIFSIISPTDVWKMYLVPFESKAAYAVNSLNIGLHLAYENQTIEIGGAACLNFKNTVFFTSLPIVLDNDKYGGIEPNAPWRAEAASSIEQLRKANFNVTVKDKAGKPINNAQIRFEMLQHEFKFGTAVVSNKFNGGTAQNATYEQKLTDLDGKGHGFDEVVFENDLKWAGWEGNWFSSKAELVSDLAWLNSKGISVRGHNLVWPGWEYSPTDITAAKGSDYLKTRIRNHLKSILSYPGIGGGSCVDWDVLNEITGNNDYANLFKGQTGYPTGRELYTEIFKQADSLAPSTKLYLNDYVAIEQGDLSSNGIATWKSRIDELQKAGANIEGLGFQGHFSAAPTSIPRVKEILDDFWKTYNLEAKVTEYDIDKFVPQDIQAKYMRDILTISYAHPSMKGFLMWGFWDGAHWLNNSPIYNTDWSLKPSGTAFIDQIFTQWWTDKTVPSSALGGATLRAFKGNYKITVTSPDGSKFSQNVTLDGDKTLTINTNTVTNTIENDIALAFATAPNPTSGNVELSWNGQLTEGKATVQISDAIGKILLEKTVESINGQAQLDMTPYVSGVYFVGFKNNQYRSVRKIILQK